ncbi:unnamed protein product [Effrenium voratum]|nr:unnamed protein product [Effrenium voratum]
MASRAAALTAALLCTGYAFAPARQATWPGALRKETPLCDARCKRLGRGVKARPSGAETSESSRGRILGAVLALALTFGASAAIPFVYPPLVNEVLRFRSKLREVVFAAFTACSILWFLGPSHWAARVSGRLRPAALRLAAQRRCREAALLFAAADFTRFALTAGQGFFAACLVVQALPPLAKYFVPFIPFNACIMTSPIMLKALGPFLGPPASLGGWVMELGSILLKRQLALLLLALGALPLGRFLWRALEPSPKRNASADVKGVLRELLRFGLCGAVVCLGAWAVLTMNGRPVPQWLPLMALVAVQPLQDLLARLGFMLKPGHDVKGFVGGAMVTGELQGFRGTNAEIATDAGVVLVPAACAWGLARAPKVRALETAAVPAERLAAALGEAKKALDPPADKKKKLLALPVLFTLAALVTRFPVAGSFLYALAVSLYLSAFVLPPPLVVILPLVILMFGGPASSVSAKGMALGLALSAIKQLVQRPSAKASVTCSALDLDQGQATLAWQTDPEAQVAEKVAAAVAGEKASSSMAKFEKKQKVKGILLSALTVVLLCGVVAWEPFVEHVEASTSQMGARLLIFGICSGLSLRLMNFGIIPSGARFVLPAPLAALSAGPSKAAHWFLAVNTRAAAAGAAAGFLLPRVGLLQKLVYHFQIVGQVAWVDAWALQMSSAFLGSVLSVQAARALNRQLPFRCSNAFFGILVAILRASLVGLGGGLVLRCVLLAAGAPGPSSVGVAGPAATSALFGLAAALLALPWLLLRDWRCRLLAARGTAAFWLRAREGNAMQPARLLKFRGRKALLRVDGEEVEVPASELAGAARHLLRPVRCSIPVSPKQAEAVAKALRAALKQHSELLSRQPLQPLVHVSPDKESIQVLGFLDRSAPPDKASAIRSELLLAAACAA